MDSNAIAAVEAELRAAQLAGDVVALDRLLDDELVYTDMNGATGVKADDLALHRSGRIRITKLNPVESRAVPLGPDVAVVLVRMDATAVIDGAAQSAHLRYTRVWRRRPSGWRVIVAHMGLVGSPGGPA